jgi:excisionase family DNA binding protein
MEVFVLNYGDTHMSTDITKVALSVTEFCKAAGIGRSFFYEEVKTGRIKVVKAGRRTLIPISELAAWLSRLAHGGEA